MAQSHPPIIISDDGGINETQFAASMRAQTQRQIDMAHRQKIDWMRQQRQHNKYFALQRGSYHFMTRESRYQTIKATKDSRLSSWKSPHFARYERRTTTQGSKSSKTARLRQIAQKAKEDLRSEENKKFLAQNDIPSLPSPAWRGIRVLGEGGQGIVGLWENQSSDPALKGLKVVVKQSNRNATFDLERDMMERLEDAGPHVVRLLTSIGGEDVEDESTRLIIEYCSGGDLNSLLIQQNEMGEHFLEKHLWLMFECFAKGLNILDHGTETVERPHGCGGPICHFDLKPLNVLRGGNDDTHTDIQICKVADLGLAMDMNRGFLTIGRRRGTPGYYAPEQFSRRWLYDVVDHMDHIDIYGTHTNVWQIGAIMYQLATLRGPPSSRGFFCRELDEFTYGNGLDRTHHSQTLKHLIWRCLADKPSSRPGLAELDQRIQTALQSLRDGPPETPTKLTWPVKKVEAPDVKEEGEVTGENQSSGASGSSQASASPRAGATAGGGGGQGDPVPALAVPGQFTFTVHAFDLDIGDGFYQEFFFSATPATQVGRLKARMRTAGVRQLANARMRIFLPRPAAAGGDIELEDELQTLMSYGVRAGTVLELYDALHRIGSS